MLFSVALFVLPSGISGLEELVALWIIGVVMRNRRQPMLFPSGPRTEKPATWLTVSMYTRIGIMLVQCQIMGVFAIAVVTYAIFGGIYGFMRKMVGS